MERTATAFGVVETCRGAARGARACWAALLVYSYLYVGIVYCLVVFRGLFCGGQVVDKWLPLITDLIEHRFIRRKEGLDSKNSRLDK